MNARLAAALLLAGELHDATPTLPPDVASKLRQELTRDDPLMFALVYLTKHLIGTDGRPSLSEVHEGWIGYALTWDGEAGPGEERDAFVAPREMGKSTWFFLLLPMWAAATKRVRFAAAFADSAAQAEGHLSTFKLELDTNELIRKDYPDLCRAARRPKGGNVSDNRAMLHTASGFVFAARGIDSGNLGMKVGELRPDLLILDDVEPGESNYSAYQVEKRLGTLTDVVLPLNVRARVCLVGTVTMPGSIVHQLVRHAKGEELRPWVKDEQWRVHHAMPILTDEDGERRSVWPEKWPLPYLLGIEHTRSFAKNFLNEPTATDGDYWRPEHFDPYLGEEGEAAAWVACTVALLSIDPAVTTSTSSDYTGLSVVGGVPAAQGRRSSAVVFHAERVRARGEQLRSRALSLLERFPDITTILVESNQGGELWLDVFHHMPVPVKIKHNTEKKEVRAAQAVSRYEAGRVRHARPLPEAEQEMCGFPKAPHDDIVDSISNAVNRLLPRAKKRKPGASASSVSY